jgi:hypothetical protein
MKLSEFMLLNEGDKKRTVFKNAVALAKRTYPDVIIFLFQFDRRLLHRDLLQRSQQNH